MDRKQIEYRIIELDRALAETPDDATLYLERGKLHYKLGKMDRSLNDFVRVREIAPDNVEAGEYVDMISEIFEFHYKDIYNP
ncbi:hypothetical protein FACS1894159_08360 [Bacteroidia bacterium]|nr:hypothetical protein FACS1894159_08360 [Bacteroidia bacterium]